VVLVLGIKIDVRPFFPIIVQGRKGQGSLASGDERYVWGLDSTPTELGAFSFWHPG
jgi:hypothetical protein